MDIEMDAEPDIGMESESDDDSKSSGGMCLRVATVANSKFFGPKDFRGFPASQDFKMLSSSNPMNSWTELKRCKPESVNSWCDYETLLLL